MSIVVQCPGCGSRYKVNARLAGKPTKCQCGEVMEVSAPAVAPPPPENEPPPDTDSTRLAAETLRKLREPIRRRAVPIWQGVPQRNIVAVLSIFYGSIMALVLLGRVASAGSSGLSSLLILAAALVLFLDVMIVAGGVLILKGHPHGPACAGLSCAVFCFFPICSAIRQTLVLLTAIRPGALILLLLYTVVVYSIPVFVVVWTLREEAAKQADDDRDH